MGKSPVGKEIPLFFLSSKHLRNRFYNGSQGVRTENSIGENTPQNCFNYQGSGAYHLGVHQD